MIYFAVFGMGILYILHLMAKPPHRGERGIAPGAPIRTAGITSIVWCIGFAPDFRWPDASGVQRRGPTQAQARYHERGRDLLQRPPLAQHLRDRAASERSAAMPNTSCR